ncbi:hypothetical protein BpHYR1_029702 [Brachionus plicatilis]|uniref:Uncharacterized protein n=1 Tax=Brachionus plicatilis TaxID=10195 RepID=A0A3M7T3R3_BRAPC|nr:hypothetical protein BpHYR1_029702 [Brachionus plicatilis]
MKKTLLQQSCLIIANSKGSEFFLDPLTSFAMFHQRQVNVFKEMWKLYRKASVQYNRLNFPSIFKVIQGCFGTVNFAINRNYL